MDEFSKGMAETVVKKLELFKDDVKARREKDYFKDPSIVFLGTGIPTVKKIVKQVVPCCRLATEKEIIQMVDYLLKSGIFEVQIAGIELLNAFLDKLNIRDTFFYIEDRIMGGQISNWASIDSVNNHTTSRIIEADESLQEETLRWTSSYNFWLRRGAAVTFILPARKGRFLDIAFHICLKLIDDKNEYVNKGAGWLLREAGTTRKDLLDDFISCHGKSMPRVMLRYAIEKYPKEEREYILKSTKTS